MFSGYNRKVATTTCPCPVRPPWNISRMMEPLSHYHCEIYCCKHVPINLHQTTCNNMYQSTCTKQPVTTCTNNLCQHVPYINLCLNLYHKQVPQPCTKPIQITCHNNMSKQPVSSILSTKSYLLTKINHQDNSQPYAQYHQDVHQPSIPQQLIIITKINMFL